MLSWVNFSIYRIYFVDPKTTKRELWDQMSELRMHQRKDQRSTSQDVEQTGVKSELIRWFETNKQMNQNSWLHGPDAWTLCWCAWRNNKQRETLAASISALACSYMAATQEVKIKCKKKTKQNKWLQLFDWHIAGSVSGRRTAAELSSGCVSCFPTASHLWMTVHTLLHANTRLANRHHPEVTGAECLAVEFKLATNKQNKLVISLSWWSSSG